MTAVAERDAEQLGLDLPSVVFSLEVRYVEHASVQPDPDQPRVDVDDELRASIARTGILQPITVRPHPTIDGEWMIVDGERRWRGAAGVQAEIPVIVREEQADEAERLRTQLVANTGKPLAPLEEARAFVRLMEMTRRSQTELAEDLGRAKSTVNDRLALLELGPWVDLIHRGELPVSHAVRVLVPLRVVPDKYHEQALERIRKDYRWQHKGEGAGISLGDFERLVETAYAPIMYPLAKTKGYGKQPEFAPKDHDTECECGGVKFDFGGGTTRLCCANPDYWRPRHRKAIALKPKEKSSAGAPRRPDFYMPEGAKVLKIGYGGTPSGVVALTSSAKVWDVNRYPVGEAFDPKDLEIDETKLVLLRTTYGTDRVGTTDAAAVKVARKKWEDRWTGRRVEIADDLRDALKKHAKMFPVRGEGARQLLQVIAAREPVSVVDCAEALGLVIPDALRRAVQHELSGKIRPWIAKLDDGDVLTLATAIATLVGRNLKTTSTQLEQERDKAIEGIQRRDVPWLTKPKGSARAKSKKVAAKADTDDEELDEEPERLDEALDDDAEE